MLRRAILCSLSCLTVLILVGCLGPGRIYPDMMDGWIGSAMEQHGAYEEKFGFNFVNQIRGTFDGHWWLFDCWEDEPIAGFVDQYGSISIACSIDYSWCLWELRFSGTVKGDYMSGTWSQYRDGKLEDTGSWYAKRH